MAWFPLAAVAFSICGCSALNPSFLALFNTDAAAFQTIPNAPGHVVVGIINNAEVDESIISYLETKMELSDAEKQALRPRIRARLRITFVDGTFQTVEFITGSKNFVDPDFAAQAVPDLNQNDLFNIVAFCDVASVQLEPGTNIEVFIPVEITTFEQEEVTNTGGTTIEIEYQPRDRIPPQFTALQADDVDEDGNVILQRNVGIRDIPGPTTNIICGSVVAITINGVLSVPFLDVEEAEGAPSYDIEDEPTVAGVGGRYEFIVSIQ